MAPPISLGEIILVENNPGDIRLTKELFKEEGVDSTINVVSDEEELLDYLYHSDAYAGSLSPDLILLNWNSLQNDGEGLAEIKGEEPFRDVPIVFLAGSDAELDIIKERGHQADAYISKPCRPDDLESALADI